MKLFEKIAKDLATLGILPALEGCGTVLCALSGGADSVVLLHFLNWYLPELEIGLAAAHLNHGIRGAAADADEAFCRGLCTALQIPFYSRRVDIPALAKEQGMGLEECARAERYAFLEQVRSGLSHGLTATAHNATDHLETVLFHLARGTGARGLCGISPIRDGKIIRPLLCCTGEEIRTFAAAEQISYVTDRTNDDTAYTRNYIRKNILPTLRQINPRCEDAALRMSRLVSEDVRCLEDAARRLLEQDGHIRRNCACSAPLPLLTRAILLLYKKYAGTAEDLSQKHLDDCTALIGSGRAGRISLPGEAALFVQGERIWIGANPAFVPSPAPKPASLSLGQAVVFGAFVVKVAEKKEQLVPSHQNIYNLSIYGALDFDKIKGSISIRARKAGDVYLSGGMHKKLRKLLQALKIPPHLRDTFPLLCDGDGILWVPGLRPRDGCGAEASTGRPVYAGVWHIGEKSAEKEGSQP